VETWIISALVGGLAAVASIIAAARLGVEPQRGLLVSTLKDRVAYLEDENTRQKEEIKRLERENEDLRRRVDRLERAIADRVLGG
jgi:predicted RNase H-like nuclease (RuvC/YqgF family)